MKTKFQLRQILNMTTGKLLTKVEDIYDVGNAVTGDNLFTHVLPRAFKFCEPEIRRQLPFLATEEHKIEEQRLNNAIGGDYEQAEVMKHIRLWLDSMEAKYGAEHELESREDTWLKLNPIEEAEAMVGKDKVIKVIA